MRRTNKVPVGWVGRGAAARKLLIELDSLCRMGLISGTTGSGKSAWVSSVLLNLLADSNDCLITVLEPKSDLSRELLDHFLPAMAETHSHIRPERTLVIRPFSKYGVPMNPLAPVPGVAPRAQAVVVADLIGAMSHTPFGVRMTVALAALNHAVLLLGGSLLDVVRLIEDATYRARAAQKVPDPEVRHYLEVTLGREPAGTLSALVARVSGQLLSHPAVRAALCATTSVTGKEILETPISVIDTAGAPMGFPGPSRFIAGWVWTLLAAAVFDRRIQPDTKRALIVVDEMAEIIRSKAVLEDFERVISMARQRRTFVWGVCQTRHQTAAASQLLDRSWDTNATIRVRFGGA